MWQNLITLSSNRFSDRPFYESEQVPSDRAVFIDGFQLLTISPWTSLELSEARLGLGIGQVHLSKDPLETQREPVMDGWLLTYSPYRAPGEPRPNYSSYYVVDLKLIT